MGRAEKRLAESPSHLNEAIRQKLEAAHHSLERAAALWTELQEKRRKDWKEYREHLSHARRQWREALRLMARVPEQA
jgi:hypothetical protein